MSGGQVKQARLIATDNSRRFNSGDKARVDSISSNGIATLTMLSADGDEGEKRRVNLRTPGIGVRNAYALTVDGVQGASLSEGEAYLTDTSANGFLVAMTRFKKLANLGVTCDFTTRVKAMALIKKASTSQEKAIVSDMIGKPPVFKQTQPAAAFWSPATGAEGAQVKDGAVHLVPVRADQSGDATVIEAKLREAMAPAGPVEVAGAQACSAV